MKPIRYYPELILQDVYNRVKTHDVVGVDGARHQEGVSDYVFVENRPKASTETLTEMVVISLPYQFHDANIVQKSALRFELIVRNKQNGIVNVKRLQEMLDGITKILPIKTDRFFAHDPYLALRGEDNVGFTIWNVQAELTVYTLDRYEV